MERKPLTFQLSTVNPLPLGAGARGSTVAGTPTLSDWKSKNEQKDYVRRKEERSRGRWSQTRRIFFFFSS
jgi:hypothetical protein